MKIKLRNKKKPIPIFDSYCGLATEDWIKLNNRGTVEVKSISEKLETFIIEVKTKKEKE